MSSLEQTAKTLGGTNVFAGLGQSTLDRIAAACETRTFAADDVLYRPGDAAEDIFVLLSGRVRFTLESGGETQSAGSVISSRMVLGWAALIPEHPTRVATAVCIQPSTLLAISGDELLEILRDDTDAGFLVMQRLAAMIARNFMDQ